MTMMVAAKRTLRRWIKNDDCDDVMRKMMMTTAMICILRRPRCGR